MLFLPVTAEAKEDSKTYDNLNAIGITLEEMGVASINDEATRAQLAYLTSKLSDGKTYEKVNTVFADVTETNELSGYVQNVYKLGIFSGKTDGSFGYGDFVTQDVINKVFTIVAGYNDFANITGGYPNGHKKAMNMIGLKITADKTGDGNITVKGMLDFAEEFLKTQYNKFSYTISGNDVNIQTTNEKTSVLSEIHNIDIYEGKITDVEDSSYCADVVITKNLSDCNGVNYSLNQKVNLKSSKNINLYALEGVKVKLWVNENRTIVNVVTTEKTSVEFLVIDSVNGDTKKDSSYSSKYIDKIVFTTSTKNYNTTKDFEIKHNFKLTTAPVNLTGKYAKVIFEDDEVAFIETWDLNEGGIVNVVGEDYIQYTQGGNTSKRISDLENYTRKILYSDTISGNFMDIKKDTYFDFYKTNDTIVLVASEKKITDKLVAISDDYVYLGNGEYLLNDNYYVKNSYGAYQKNGDLSRLFNETVSAYFNAKKECCYFEIYDNSTLANKEFTGIILGSKSDTWGSNTQLKVFSFEDNGKTEVYDLKDKCILPSDKTRSEILAIKDDVNAQYIFKFILNDKKEITEITYPQYFYYYGKNGVMDAKVENIAQIPYNDEKYFVPSYKDANNTTVSGENWLYVRSAPVKVLVADKKGDLSLNSVNWGTIYGMYGKKINIHAFGDDFSQEPSLVLVCGQTETLVSRLASTGFVTNSYVALDKDGEKVNKVEVISSGTQEYTVDNATLSKLGTDFDNDPCYIQFKTYTYNNENDICLDTVEKGVKLSTILNNPTENGFTEATVSKTNSKRVYFTDGKTAELSSDTVIFKTKPDGGIEKITLSDISEGENVIYTYVTKGIKLMIVK